MVASVRMARNQRQRRTPLAWVLAPLAAVMMVAWPRQAFFSPVSTTKKADSRPAASSETAKDLKKAPKTKKSKPKPKPDLTATQQAFLALRKSDPSTLYRWRRFMQQEGVIVDSSDIRAVDDTVTKKFMDGVETGTIGSVVLAEEEDIQKLEELLGSDRQAVWQLRLFFAKQAYGVNNPKVVPKDLVKSFLQRYADGTIVPVEMASDEQLAKLQERIDSGTKSSWFGFAEKHCLGVHELKNLPSETVDFALQEFKPRAEKRPPAEKKPSAAKKTSALKKTTAAKKTSPSGGKKGSAGAMVSKASMEKMIFKAVNDAIRNQQGKPLRSKPTVDKNEVRGAPLKQGQKPLRDKPLKLYEVSSSSSQKQVQIDGSTLYKMVSSYGKQKRIKTAVQRKLTIRQMRPKRRMPLNRFTTKLHNAIQQALKDTPPEGGVQYNVRSEGKGKHKKWVADVTLTDELMEALGMDAAYQTSTGKPSKIEERAKDWAADKMLQIVKAKFAPYPKSSLHNEVMKLLKRPPWKDELVYEIEERPWQDGDEALKSYGEEEEEVGEVAEEQQQAVDGAIGTEGEADAVEPAEQEPRRVFTATVKLADTLRRVEAANKGLRELESLSFKGEERLSQDGAERSAARKALLALAAPHLTAP